MKRIELKKEYREHLASSYTLRCLIGTDILVHQQTIQRWATNNNPKLTTKHFIDAFKKHAKIDEVTEVTEEVEVNFNHLHVA